MRPQIRTKGKTFGKAFRITEKRRKELAEFVDWLVEETNNPVDVAKHIWNKTGLSDREVVASIFGAGGVMGAKLMNDRLLETQKYTDVLLDRLQELEHELFQLRGQRRSWFKWRR